MKSVWAYAKQSLHEIQNIFQNNFAMEQDLKAQKMRSKEVKLLSQFLSKKEKSLSNNLYQTIQSYMLSKEFGKIDALLASVKQSPQASREIHRLINQEVALAFGRGNIDLIKMR